MKDLKKYFILFIILTFVFIFSGCADIDIRCRITPNNIVIVKYIANIDTTKLSLENNTQLCSDLKEIRSYWKSLGYEDVEIDLSNPLYNISITLTMEEECQSREEAFDTLYQIMTNELSVFDEIEYNYINTYHSEGYSISGKIDISEFLDKEEIERIYPSHVLTDLDKDIADSTFKLCFSLPVNSGANSDSIKNEIYSQYLSFYDTNEFNVSGVIINSENTVNEAAAIANSIDNFKRLMILCGIFIILLFILLVLVGRRIRFNKKLKKDKANTQTDDSSL